MSVHSGNEVEGEVEGDAVLLEAEGEGEGSFQTLNDAEVEGSEDVSSSYVSGETDSEEMPRMQQGSETAQLDVIREQSTPLLTGDGDDAAAVAKGEDVETVETEELEEVPSQEAILDSETGKEEEILSEKQDEFEHEYITPIEDPYQKALKYFAKHGILELFGVTYTYGYGYNSTYLVSRHCRVSAVILFAKYLFTNVFNRNVVPDSPIQS